MMNRPATLSMHTGFLILLFLCIADCLFLKDTDHSIHKRGFRKNPGSRLGHGFGKRDYRSPPSAVDRLFDNTDDDDDNDDDSVDNGDIEALLPSRKTRNLFEARRKLLHSMVHEFQRSTVLSTKEFAKLLQQNEELADVIVRKFIDINDDDMVSSDELYRRVRE